MGIYYDEDPYVLFLILVLLLLGLNYSYAK